MSWWEFFPFLAPWGRGTSNPAGPILIPFLTLLGKAKFYLTLSNILPESAPDPNFTLKSMLVNIKHFEHSENLLI